LCDDLLRSSGIVHLVISTPGRILDLVSRDVVKLNNCKILVLDEADKWLSQDFMSTVDRLVAHMPTNRQIMLYSASFPSIIASFTAKHMRNPYEIDLREESNVSQFFEWLWSEAKALLSFILSGVKELSKSVLIWIKGVLEMMERRLPAFQGEIDVILRMIHTGK
jgi:ATP-dependent RNA helicase DDX6/DHH1